MYINFGQWQNIVFEKLVEIAKIQSIEASNAIDGIVTTSMRIRHLVEEKTIPKNRDEQEIAGDRDVLAIISQIWCVVVIQGTKWMGNYSGSVMVTTS